MSEVVRRGRGRVRRRRRRGVDGVGELMGGGGSGGRGSRRVSGRRRRRPPRTARRRAARLEAGVHGSGTGRRRQTCHNKPHNHQPLTHTGVTSVLSARGWGKQ